MRVRSARDSGTAIHAGAPLRFYSNPAEMLLACACAQKNDQIS